MVLPREPSCPLKIHPDQEIRRVVVRGSSTRPIVVGFAPIELGVPGVLKLELRVEPGQIVDLKDVSVRIGAEVRAAGDGGCGVQERIAAASNIEIADRTADLALVVVLTRKLERL